MEPNDALISFLVEHNVLSERPSKAELGSISQFPLWGLSQNGHFEELDAIHAISKHLEIPYCDLDSSAISEKLAIDEYVNIVDASFCWTHRVIPLYEENDKVFVASANPFNREAIQSLSFTVSKPVEVIIAEESKILKLMSIHLPNAQFEANAEGQTEAQSAVEAEIFKEEEESIDISGKDTAPIIRLVNKVLGDAFRFGASDVHMEPGQSVMEVRFRIDGKLYDIIKIPRKVQGNVVARIKILGGMDISENRKPQDGRMRVRIGENTVDLRVSTIPTSFGEKVVMRLLCADYSSLSFKELGFDVPVQKRWESALGRTGKLVLVTGPTGSGKTTTLYVSLNQMLDGTQNITTIEDPVEYRFAGLNQIQVNRAVNVTFASVLRSVLRQDPDTIMVGEIRDNETLQVVLSAAQTGHLVLSTLHTNDAPSALTRLKDLGGDPHQISNSLLGVMAQRLVRRVCDKCSRPLTPSELNDYDRHIDAYGLWSETLRKGDGCPHCYYSGYKGRVGIYSYLEVNDAVSEAIFEEVHQEELIAIAKTNGFKELDETAVELLHKGTTTLSEVAPYLDDMKRPQQHRSSSEDKDESAKVFVPNQSFTSQRSKSVLIVDTSSTIRNILKMLLERESIEVFEATNHDEITEVLDQHTPGVILTDYMIPGSSAYELLQYLNTEKSMQSVETIIFSGELTHESELALRKLGATDVLSKSSCPQKVMSHVRRLFV